MTNRALLVGIDNYPNPINHLNSCVADTLAFRNLLNQYDFTDSDVRFLHDSDATLANVLSGLDWLFDGAQPGDRRVFFESSHGYRYLKDGTMVEVLCLYDQFLEDHELSRRSQNIPQGVLTVVLDACHSGGMDKLYFVDGISQIARAKVFTPDPDQGLSMTKEISFATSTAIPVKFFGRSVVGDLGAISKNFATVAETVPVTKDVTGGDVEINAVLLTACRADQTAAAGSTATNNLSAFTFALTDQLDTSIPVSTLCDRIVSRLSALQMAQTPTVFAPDDQQYLLTETFVSEQPVTETSNMWESLFADLGSAPSTESFLTSTDTTSSESKEFGPMTTMATPTAVHTTIENILGTIASNAGATPDGGPAAAATPAYMNDVAACAAKLVPAFAVAAKRPSASKAMTVPQSIGDPANLQSKSFWDAVISVAESTVPVVLDALSKDMTVGTPQMTASAAGSQLASQISPQRLQDKDFWSSAFSVLETVVPAVLSAASGQKAFTSGISLSVPPAHAQDKGWFDDVMSVVQVAAPIILAAA